MNWFSNKAQIIQTIASLVACLLALANSVKQSSNTWLVIGFAALLVISVAAAFLLPNSARDSDHLSKVRALKELRDMQANLPDALKLSPERLAELGQRLKQETEGSMDALMGWKKEADKFGAVLGWVSVIVAMTLANHLLIVIFEIQQQALSHFGPGPAAIVGCAQCVALFWIFRTIVYEPVRTAAAEKGLRFLRTNKGPLSVLTLAVAIVREKMANAPRGD